MFKREQFVLYCKLSTLGLIKKHTSHMKRWVKNSKWDDENEIIKEISLYTNLKDFREKSRTCYKYVINNNKTHLLQPLVRKNLHTIVSYEECRKWLKNNGIKTSTDHRKNKQYFPTNIPRTPERVYKNMWSGWTNFLN